MERCCFCSNPLKPDENYVCSTCSTLSYSLLEFDEYGEQIVTDFNIEDDCILLDEH